MRIGVRGWKAAAVIAALSLSPISVEAAAKKLVAKPEVTTKHHLSKKGSLVAKKTEGSAKKTRVAGKKVKNTEKHARVNDGAKSMRTSKGHTTK